MYEILFLSQELENTINSIYLGQTLKKTDQENCSCRLMETVTARHQ